MDNLLLIVLSLGLCSANFVVYHHSLSVNHSSANSSEYLTNILNSTYLSAYSDNAFIPPMNKLYYLVLNLSECDEDSVIIVKKSYGPTCRTELLSRCAGVMLSDREIYFGVLSPQKFPELFGLLDNKFVIMTPGSSVSKIMDIVNRSLNNISDNSSLSNISSESRGKLRNPRIQIGHTTFRPWHDSSLEKYTVKICIAGMFFLLGYLARIYDISIRDTGKYIFTEWSISSILHAVSVVYTIISICFIVDPLYTVGIFSPRVGVIISCVPLCLPAPCLLVVAFYWKDSIDKVMKTNFMSRYGSLFILCFSIVGGVMIILVLAGAFVSDMENFYPYIRGITVMIAVINCLALILYIVCITAVIVEMSRIGMNVDKYVIITQILVSLGIISQFIGCVITFTGLSEVGDYAGYYNSYKWLTFRLGEVLCMLALSRQLGGFNHSVDVCRTKTKSGKSERKTRKTEKNSIDRKSGQNLSTGNMSG